MLLLQQQAVGQQCPKLAGIQYSRLDDTIRRMSLAAQVFLLGNAILIRTSLAYR